MCSSDMGRFLRVYTALVRPIVASRMMVEDCEAFHAKQKRDYSSLAFDKARLKISVVSTDALVVNSLLARREEVPVQKMKGFSLRKPLKFRM